MVAADTLSDELRALSSGSQAQVDAGRAVIAAMSLQDASEMQAVFQAHSDFVSRGMVDLGSGELPLCLAARTGNAAAAAALLAAGAPVDARNGIGKTALQVSRTFEECDVEAVLLRGGAHDPEAGRFSLSLGALTLLAGGGAATLPAGYEAGIADEEGTDEDEGPFLRWLHPDTPPAASASLRADGCAEIGAEAVSLAKLTMAADCAAAADAADCAAAPEAGPALPPPALSLCGDTMEVHITSGSGRSGGVPQPRDLPSGHDDLGSADSAHGAARAVSAGHRPDDAGVPTDAGMATVTVSSSSSSTKELAAAWAARRAPMQVPHAVPHAAHNAPRAAPAAKAAQPARPAAAAAPVASAAGAPAAERPAAAGAVRAASARTRGSSRQGLPVRVGLTSLRRSHVLSIPVAAANRLVAYGGSPGLVGCGCPDEEVEDAAKAAMQIAAAAKRGVSLPVCLATDVARFLHEICSLDTPAGGGVVFALFLNAKLAVGGIGVEPYAGDVLRVLFTDASNAVADVVVRNRCCLSFYVDSSAAVFDVLSDRQEAQHQALWPAVVAAKAAGKRAQFHRARLVVDSERVAAPAC
ncbi:hypothetical protein FOA52_010288 [Chlamydomonas sp. UWO 241]|nr:hypothetical protein FOA52_010288 [Chlamydomonas sp. UWO 241]